MGYNTTVLLAVKLSRQDADCLKFARFVWHQNVLTNCYRNQYVSRLWLDSDGPSTL